MNSQKFTRIDDLEDYISATLPDGWEVMFLIDGENKVGKTETDVALASNYQPKYNFIPLFYNRDNQTWFKHEGAIVIDVDGANNRWGSRVYHSNKKLIRLTNKVLEVVRKQENKFKVEVKSKVKGSTGKFGAPLPGDIASAEESLGCQNHYHRPTYVSRCVESDSFGSEFMDMCYGCEQQRLAEIKFAKTNEVLWEECRCGNKQPALQSYRDPDEGSHGPVYERCDKCCERFWKNWHEANRIDDEDYDHYDY